MASQQSDVIASREVLENEFSRLNNEFSSLLPECPDYWGGTRGNIEEIKGLGFCQ